MARVRNDNYDQVVKNVLQMWWQAEVVVKLTEPLAECCSIHCEQYPLVSILFCTPDQLDGQVTVREDIHLDKSQTMRTAYCDFFDIGR